MVYRPEVVDAFDTLGVTPDVDEAVACKAYKKLALLHHPDRNHGDRTSTARFQQIGAAWSVCQAHYENPMSSDQRDFGTGGPGGARYPPFWDLDPEDLEDFFEQMMREVFMTGRFQRRSGGGFDGIGGGLRFQFRGSEGGYGGGTASGGIRSYRADPVNSQSSRSSNVDMQKKEKEKFKKRMQEFEREVEAEEREIERATREMKKADDRRASARVNAFEFARSGDSSAVRHVIEEHQIDVNGPERVSKNPKKPQIEKYDTLLHTAVAHCDKDLISFLIEKGALLTTLNKTDLTPFHVSILAGNTQVTRYFLNRRAKSQDGCHPSKAAPDGRTPLQLAVASKNPSMVELLLKDATVHDVERLWEQPLLPFSLKAILETKKGFIPSEVQENGVPISRKTRQKLEVLRRVAAEKEVKEKRLAEERARAEDNARRKRERRDKLIAEERKFVEQRKMEEAEHILFTDGDMCLSVEREAPRKVEEESPRNQEEALRESECRSRSEHSQRKVEIEAKAQREAVEVRTRQRDEIEARQKEREKRRRQQGEQPNVERKREQERGEKMREDRENFTMAAHEVIDLQEARDMIQVVPPLEEQQRKAELEILKNKKKAEADAAAKRLVTLARLQAQAEEMKNRGTVAPVVVVGDTDENHAVTMRKRAEQSARDKARYQKSKAEKEKLAAVNVAETANISSPGVLDKLRPKNKKMRQPPAADSSTTHSFLPKVPVPLTLTSMASSPPFQSTNHTEQQGSLSQTSALLFSPVTPESFQTCAIPDDLFQYERPPGFRGDEVSNRSEFYSVYGVDGDPSRDHTPRRGRGWRGRGRGRGRNQRSGGGQEKYENSTKDQGFVPIPRRRARSQTGRSRPIVTELGN